MNYPLGGFSAGGIRRDVDVGPVIWRNQTLSIESEALYAWLEQVGCGDLFDRHPGYLVDQLLLELVVGVQASGRVLHQVGLLKLLLDGLLERSVRAFVLAEAHAVLGRALVELEGGPVLGIGIVSNPGGTGIELERVAAAKRFVTDQLVEVDVVDFHADTQC